MSVLIESWKYKRMLRRRVNLIQKKLKEIEEIKLKYGTVPTIGDAKMISGIVERFRPNLED